MLAGGSFSERLTQSSAHAEIAPEAKKRPRLPQAGVTQPIFNARRTRSRVALSRAQQEETVLAYQQTIQRSFREVSDALVGYRKGRDFREQQQLLNRSAEDARRLAEIRYRGGATSYLELLDSDTRMFSAELGVTQAELSELLAFVHIYRALGGGWQPEN